MPVMTSLEKSWKDIVIKRDEIERYFYDGGDFINDQLIESLLARAARPGTEVVRGIIDKARAIETLLPEETATLLNVQHPELWEEIFDAAAKIKKAVYDNRVVTFAPVLRQPVREPLRLLRIPRGQRRCPAEGPLLR